MELWMPWNWIDWSLLSRACDVLIVSFIIYKLLLLVRGTRAQPMLLGLGIVMLVYLASTVLSLVTLNWILGNFLGSVILVIVVLFQDDLRRALTKVGLISGFGSETVGSIEISIRELTAAALELASKRVGALIVVQREVGLQDYTEHAVHIDGIVNRQLLVSIFNPISPLHDGAVVIDRDRIVAAGAVLPLTFNPNISSDLGTRHRAGIGLSERTDAVVVVVSEETGQVSLIREGRITRDLNEKSLNNALNRLLILGHKRGRKKVVVVPAVDGPAAEKSASSGPGEGEPEEHEKTEESSSLARVTTGAGVEDTSA